MRKTNRLAACLIALVFVVLALLPLTQEPLRFDMQLAAGKPLLGRTLLEYGIKQADLPFNGLGPVWKLPPVDTRVPSAAFAVRLASVLQLSGREKWLALQALVEEYPSSVAAHAALARMACKNGGSVGVGHDGNNNRSQDPNDPLILLRSCAAGEQLDPDNAYFPTMAAVAHLALNQDEAAWADLHRAAGKPHWREYIDVEAQGRFQRATLLYGPQNSLTESTSYAGILFPHYAQLRALARVVAAQPSSAKNRVARQDTVAVALRLRDESSSLIGALVGLAMAKIAQTQPDGTSLGLLDPALEARTQTLVKDIDSHTIFSGKVLFRGQAALLVNLVLLGLAIVVCALGGIALLRPWLGVRGGRVLSVVLWLAFLTVVLTSAWTALGNVRDILAFTGCFMTLSGDDAPHQTVWLQQAFLVEGIWVVGAVVLLCILRWKRVALLPLAAVLTVLYAAHLTTYAVRETQTRAELRQIISHEARALAQKLGTTW